MRSHDAHIQRIALLSQMQMPLAEERAKIEKDVVKMGQVKELYQSTFKPGLFSSLAGLHQNKRAH